MQYREIFSIFVVLFGDSLSIALDALLGLVTPVRLAMSQKAEILFLRKQLGLYEEREAPRRRTDEPFRRSMVFLSRFFDWCDAL
ncbi:MAG: hypothetical protein DRJ61_14945, partial [Acidobacteria bacterium]